MSTVTQHHLVPAVSSGTAGPLGILHLPRLWLKLTLGAAGRLPAGYDECGPGFDQVTLGSLGLDRDETMAFVRTEHPTYMQFEAWILAKHGGSIPAETIEKHNAIVRGYNHADDLAASMRTASGIADASIKDAVTLNTVEDLDAIHHQVSGH